MSEIIIVSGLGGKYGSGHFTRSREMIDLFPLKERPRHYIVHLSQGKIDLQKNEKSFSSEASAVFSAVKSSPKVILCDCRELSDYSQSILKNFNGKVVSVDTAGKETTWVDYLINPIPSLQPKGFSNLARTDFLPPPPKITKRPIAKHFGVIFFGFEDSMAWTKETLIDILEKKYFGEVNKKRNWAIFIGNGNPSAYRDELRAIVKKHQATPFIEFFPQTKDFYPILIQAKIFIGHFGLSSLAAIHAGISTLFRPPTTYHHVLVKRHFSQLDYSKAKLEDFDLRKMKKWANVYRKDLNLGGCFKDWPKLLSSISEKSPFICPHCQSKDYSVLFRKPEQSILQCKGCALVQVVHPLNIKKYRFQKPIKYTDKYFLEEYQKSYGKTYQEDRENIYALSSRRLGYIQKIRSSGHILDIGAALGFFLDQAKQKGYKTSGVEISAYAAKKASQRHQIFQKDILKTKLDRSFDIVCLWYVVEHFSDFHALFRTIAELQNKGGVLAMGTPNFTGLTGRFEQKKFCDSSPPDHYYLYSPGTLKQVLSPYGYKAVKIIQTGVHYSRFKKLFPRLSHFVPQAVYLFLAQVFHLGDTFEIYFKKVK